MTPALAGLRASRFPIETGLLLGLCFVLPLLEAPKNLLWFAYVLTWLTNRARTGDFGGRWDLWDTLIAAWIGSGFVVAAFAGIEGGEWRGALDLLRYGSVLWLVKRGGYGGREARWVLGALVASTVVGLIAGYGRLWAGIGQSQALQLHSVGHVNHTAVYLAIMLGVCVAWLLGRARAWGPWRRIAAGAATALVFGSLLFTGSRGAVGVGLVLIVVLAAAWWPRWRAPLAVAAGVVGLAMGLAVVAGAEFITKHRQNVAAENVLSFRDGIWRAGIVAWRANPWFGVGMGNYSRITPERVQRWSGEPHDPSRYAYFGHGHSLYFNTLAERGAVGSLALAAVLLAWLVFLVRYRPRRDDADDAWVLWGAAASAWFVTVSAGAVNTTLHSEHGLLAVLLLGLWLSGPLRAPPRRPLRGR